MISTRPANDLLPTVAVPQSVCAQMADGLHAAAQPLTVLLASLSREHTEAMQATELRELTISSLSEVERVCTLFHYLQELLSAVSMEPELAPTPILPLVQQVAEGIRQLFEQDGMRLQWAMPSDCPLICLDRARTMHALSNVLFAAHTVSSENDTIEVVVSCRSAGAVHIAVRSGDGPSLRPETERTEVELGLGMAVAEANIRCQRGFFSWTLRPFRVDITLQQRPMPGGRQ